MNEQEFSEWFDYHSAAFTGIPEWMAKRPAAAETMHRWRSVLMNVNLADARLATDLLFSQEDQPRGYDKHPAAILTIAKKNKAPEPFRPRTVIDGEETYRCLTCSDTGVVICWHPDAMRRFRDHGNLDDCKGQTCAKACTCVEGDKYARQYGIFNPKKWVPYGGIESENLARLKHFLENAKDVRRERAFDAFN